MTPAWLFLLGVFLTTAASAVSVPLVASYGAADLTWLRFASALVIFPVVLWLRPGTLVCPTRRQIGGLAVLGLASLIGLFLMLFALQGLELATTTGIFFCYPFIAVSLAALVLRERIGLQVWVLTGLGFLGVFLLFNPNAAGISAYSLAALGSGLAVAVKMMLTRGLGLGLPPMTTAAGEALAAVLVLLPFISLAPIFSGQLLGHLALYLILANASRFLIVLALARADLAGLAALGYSEVVFAALFQWLAFGQPVSAFELVAFAVILAAGLGVARGRCGRPGPSRGK